MSMTLTLRKELYKLREVVHFLLAGAGGSAREGQNQGHSTPSSPIVCYFCNKLLHDLEFITHGNAVGPKFECAVSIHHINGNHDDNTMSNKALCHTSCHKGHHRREANLARAAKK